MNGRRFIWKILWPMIVFLSLSTHSTAFNKTGHQTIAALSFRLLDLDGRAYIADLLGKNARQEWIASANWPAEQSKIEGQEWRRPLHKVWFNESDTEFTPDQNCPFSACSVGAVLESRQVLLMPEFSVQQKRQAIKYLQHYIADLHQPTNCGNLQDKGGASIKLKTSDLTRVNLHWVWEEGIIEMNGKNWSQFSSQLIQNYPIEKVVLFQQNLDPKIWAWECHKVAVDTAYDLSKSGKWNMTHYKAVWKTYERQIVTAASRIAAIINELGRDTANQ